MFYLFLLLFLKPKILGILLFFPNDDQIWELKGEIPTSENHRGFRFVSVGSFCHAKSFFPKSGLWYFSCFSFVFHLSLKQFINSFVPFPSFHEKRKVKRRKRKEPWRNHQALSSCQRYVVPASIKLNCLPSQQCSRTNVQILLPHTPRAEQ